jgi:thiamine transporter ThiT
MQAFKKPIHREDLMPVLLSGIFIAIVSGLLTGAIKLMIEETFSLYLQLIFK